MLCGPNGAGKTTLVRVLATALSPTSGALELFGSPPETARPRIGMVSHADHHYDDFTARENLLLSARLGAGRPERVPEVLREVGLDDRADDVVRTFSAGMRKRLAFARLLLKAPALVLLDEPYAGLDPAGGTFVDGLLARWRAAGTSVVISTHQLARVAPACDGATVLAHGRVSWQGPAEEAATRMAALGVEAA
jgi:heme exporter protein A